MEKSDEVPWNSMLMGYATNGHGIEALALFDKMRQAGAVPNAITFTGLLSACDHCGMVEEGRKWFNRMKCDYHIDPGIEHYACIVDLLSRASYIEEAMDLIEEMPFKADANMLSPVLRGCVWLMEIRLLGRKLQSKSLSLILRILVLIYSYLTYWLP